MIRVIEKFKIRVNWRFNLLFVHLFADQLRISSTLFFLCFKSLAHIAVED